MNEKSIEIETSKAMGDSWVDDGFESADSPGWVAVGRAAAELRLRAEGISVLASSGKMLLATGVEESADGETTMRDSCSIIPSDGKWSLRYWETGGTAGPNDVWHEVPDFGSAIDLAVRWFSGRSSTIAGWNVPAHRHPEWDEGIILDCILRAVVISGDRWRVIAAGALERREALIRSMRSGQKASWNDQLSAAFTPVQRSDGTRSQTLWLRRDLAEAYVVG